MIKLSELAAGAEVTHEGAIVLTAEELRSEIKAGNYDGQTWYTIKRKRWQPIAQIMLDNYLEEEARKMPERWHEMAHMCINPGVIAGLQAELDKAFEGDFATSYFEYVEPVEIDIHQERERTE